MIRICGACNAQFDAATYRDPACTACGVIAPTRPRSCPICDVPFDGCPVHDLSLDRCGSCDGVFVDASVVEQLAAEPTVERCDALLAALSRDVTGAHHKRDPLRCPTCNELMQRKLSESGAGIVMDVCHKHGVFFDAGELPRIIAFARQEAQRAAREGFAAGATPPIVVPLQPPAPPRTDAETSDGDAAGAAVGAIGIVLRIIIAFL